MPRWGWVILGALVGFAVVMWLTRWLSSRRVGTIGVVDGRLHPCPNKPNCVSSQATGAHAIELFRFDGPPTRAWQCLIEVLRGFPRCRIVTQTDCYLHVEAWTPIFGFVDDVEFLLTDDAIHLRSASRLGYSDLGTNRRRAEAIRHQFEQRCRDASRVREP
ncbi:MAG: DUF1499 domain-containing protein [Gemmataceae bacterium]|nr:DUF1499 domain-containing protein [Gemmataceae bacterium]